jgi:hypothetical protein
MPSLQKGTHLGESNGIDIQIHNKMELEKVPTSHQKGTHLAGDKMQSGLSDIFRAFFKGASLISLFFLFVR